MVFPSSPQLERPLQGNNAGAASPRVHEERINVTVRVRPLSEKEAAANDRSAWQCVDDKTLLYTEPVPERAPLLYPKSYTFDRVFSPTCPSEQVYLDAAREVVLSSLNGLNATIFAYGQTSSGKTYTMRGVTENAVHDIFAHIAQTPQREYLLRISALEIYNEVVKDLLNPENGAALRLLDDPERGTVVEKLTEEVVRSSGHLQQLLLDCASQRQVADTMLNDASSRSHQIIRLTVESCPRGPLSENPEAGQVLVSSLNFVDLAGSERASQTLAEGTRLKEGGHINRSLLTLGTVIRKLSSAKRSSKDHIPYRDSKLTRILQHSLGGNARTAIICTLSPAVQHVEQSRNTLSFALRATEVTNSAQVNLVVSDKVLIKQLQKEVARLEAELLLAQDNVTGLRERDAKIHEIEMQMHEVCSQRDSAQERVRELTKLILRSEKDAKKFEDHGKSWSPDNVKKLLKRSGLRKKGSAGGGRLAPSEEGGGSVESTPITPLGSTGRFLEYRELRERRRERERREREKENAELEKEKAKLESMHEQMGEGADQAIAALHKEIECLRVAQTKSPNYGNVQMLIEKLQSDLERIQASRQEGAKVNASMEKMIQVLREELELLQSTAQADEKADQDIATLEARLESAQLSLDKLYDPLSAAEDKATPSQVSVPKPSPNTTPPTSPPPLGGVQNRESAQEDSSHEGGRGGVSGSEASHRPPATSLDIRRMQKMFKTAAEENVRSIKNYVTELKERIAKLQYQKQLLLCQILELEQAAKRNERNNLEYDSCGGAGPPREGWASRLEEQASAIIQLWDMCNVSLLHRTQFYLLFSSAAPHDNVYLEVEHRRLEWLREQCLATLDEGQEEPGAIRGSLQHLRHERSMLVARMRHVLTSTERERLFAEWGVDRNSKERKRQLAGLLWSDPYDRKGIKDSAELVARLMGFSQLSHRVPKEMFGLQYAQEVKPRGWLGRLVAGPA